jgi:hypothetical protein
MGAVTSLATMGLNLALQRQAQRAEDKRLQKDRDRQLRDIAASDAESSRQQDLALRRRLAEERARAGGAGVGGTGGSADAILRGLEEEGRAAQAAQADEAVRKADLVRDTFGERRRSNLLEFSSRWLSAGGAALGGGSGTRRNRSLLD